MSSDKSHEVVECSPILPHLESWEKMMKLPVVEAAWHQSEEIYTKVKGEEIRSNFMEFYVSIKVQFLTSFLDNLKRKSHSEFYYKKN
jgi:hypothetical protein